LTKGSINFDRAAEYYDRTRYRGQGSTKRVVDLLVPELLARGRSLEIGVGTGQIALPMSEAGVRVFGMDISSAMVAIMLEKSDRRPVPVVLADATAMPFGDGVFGSAYFRWVLHLIGDWRGCMNEAVRVVGSGGLVAGILGGYSGRREEIRRRVCEILGTPTDPLGLNWGDTVSLDAHMATLGCTPRLIGPPTEEATERLDEFLDEVDQGMCSWTWSTPADDLHEAVARTRAWAEEKWGPLDREVPAVYESCWRAYDVP
jgi:SAM-dependent methyltransferase